MTQAYRTLRAAPSGEGVLGVGVPALSRRKEAAAAVAGC